MSKEFDFGGYGKEIAEAIEEVKEEKDKPTPAPRKDYKKENTQLKKKIRELEAQPKQSEIKIPTLIRLEGLLKKYARHSQTPKFLHERINTKKQDRATVQKLLDFWRFALEEGEQI